MRATVARIAIIAVTLAALTGCQTGSSGLAWNKWKFGKSKDTELATAPPSQYPALPSESATPTPPDVQLAGAQQYGVTAPGAISYPSAPQTGAYGVAGSGMYNPAGAATPQTGAYNPNYAQAAPATNYGTPDPYAGYAAQQTGYNTGATGYATPPADYNTAPYTATTPAAAYVPNTAVADNRGYYAPTTGQTTPQTAPATTTGDRYSNYNSSGYDASGTAPPASTTGYQPGVTGYQAGTSEYQPGATGYQPGATGYQPPGVPAYQSPAGAYPASTMPPTTSETPYRPGSTSDYVPRGAQSSTSGGGPVAAASYDSAGPATSAPAVYTPPATATY